jgi:hypothetical protein
MKSGNLNFLEPSGPLQACNGTVLPLTVVIWIYIKRWTVPLKRRQEDNSNLHRRENLAFQNWSIFVGFKPTLSTHTRWACKWWRCTGDRTRPLTEWPWVGQHVTYVIRFPHTVRLHLNVLSGTDECGKTLWNVRTRCERRIEVGTT